MDKQERLEELFARRHFDRGGHPVRSLVSSIQAQPP
jgi:hypothetical protein